jgi:hypothetical protein
MINERSIAIVDLSLFIIIAGEKSIIIELRQLTLHTGRLPMEGGNAGMEKSGPGPAKKLRSPVHQKIFNRDHFPARKFSTDPCMQFPDPHAGE